MPKYRQTNCEHFISTEYTWYSEEHDECGSYITKDNIPDWLGKPIVLYFNEDLIFQDNEDSNDWRVQQAIEFKEFKSIKGIQKRLKDRNLVADLEKNGGISYFIGDSEHGYVILFWVGKTQKQVNEILITAETDFENNKAEGELFSAMKTLLNNLSAEQLKLKIIEIYDHAVAEHVQSKT